MKLFTTQFTPPFSLLETNIPLGSLSKVKFRIATGHLILLEMNVLSSYVFKNCAGWDTAFIARKVTKECPLLLLVNVGCRQVGTLESEEVKWWDVECHGYAAEELRWDLTGFGVWLYVCMGRAALSLNFYNRRRNILGWDFDGDIGRAAWKACSATWSWALTQRFLNAQLQPRKNLRPFGRSQDLPKACWLAARIPVL